MNLSQLAKLGKVGGIPGIALGAGVSVLLAVLAQTRWVPEAWRGPLLLFIALAALCLGVIALVGWIRGGGDRIVAKTEGDSSEARIEDAGKNTANLKATTRGKESPAVVIRR